MTRLQFDPMKHRYTLDGRWIPGTTGIIGKAINKPHLVAWIEKLGQAEANRVRDASAEFGTRVHAMVESINLGTHRYRIDGHLNVDDDLRPFADAYLEWFQAEVLEVVGAETLVYSEEHWYAGTADGILLLRGRTHPTLADLKTSKGDYPHDEWGLQIVAYQVAALESLGLVTTSRMVIHMPSDRPGKLFPIELPQAAAAADWKAFLHCRGIYDWIAAKEAEKRRPAGRLVVPAAARPAGQRAGEGRPR